MGKVSLVVMNLQIIITQLMPLLQPFKLVFFGFIADQFPPCSLRRQSKTSLINLLHASCSAPDCQLI